MIDERNLNSSYRRNNFGEVFEALAFTQRPRTTVEIGVLEGYSAYHLGKYSEKLILCDLFEKFQFHHAEYKDICRKFPEAHVARMDFYRDHDEMATSSLAGEIDLLHIDIANTGDTYRHFRDHYLPLLSERGLAILEGGSKDRDEYWWMKAFKRPPIQAALDEFRAAGISFHVIEAFPSLTIVRK